MALYSYIANLGKRMLIALRTNPNKQKRYPEQSARQARPKYYTATVNGFQIMQRFDGMTQRHREACAVHAAAIAK
jgi:hypothetical protein